MLHAEGWHINHKRVERIWAARGAEGTDEAAEAGQTMAQRRVVHPSQAALAEPCLGL